MPYQSRLFGSDKPAPVQLDPNQEIHLTAIRELPRDERYLDLLKQYAVEGADALELKRGVVRCNARDGEFLRGEKRFEALRAHVNEKTGRSGELQLAEETIPAAGGLVIESEDGRVSYQNTFDDIVRRNRDTLLAIAAEKLFQREASDE